MAFYVRSICVVLSCLFFLTACVEDETILESNDIRNRVVGKLVDVDTLAQVGSADVTLWIDDQQATVMQVSAEGAFSFDDVPNGTHRLEITAQGYATISSLVHVESENDDDGQYFLGDIGLSQELKLTVMVSDEDGNPVNGGRISVISHGYIGANERCRSQAFTVLRSENTRSAAIENGNATISGLNGCEVYKIIVPSFDMDGDGHYDFVSFVTESGYYNDEYGLDLSEFQGPLQIVLSPLTDAVPLSVIHVSGGVDLLELDSDYPWGKTVGYKDKISGHSDFYVVRTVAANQELKLFFSSPVEELDPITVNYGFVNDPVVVPNPDRGVDTGAVISFNSEKTIMTVTPPEGGYISNQTLSFGGELVPVGDIQYVKELEIETNVYVKPDIETAVDIIIHEGEFFIIASQWLAQAVFTVSRGSESEYFSVYNSSLVDANSLGCTSCDDTIVNSVYKFGGYEFFPPLQAGDQVTVTLRGEDIEDNDVVVAEILTVKASIEDSPLVNN